MRACEGGSVWRWECGEVRVYVCGESVWRLVCGGECVEVRMC